MIKLLRLTGMVGVVLTVALAAALLRPEWARDLGLPPCPRTATVNAPPPESEVLAMITAAQRRIEARSRIVTALLDGRITLFEAAAGFQRLNRESSIPLLMNFPGDSQEERVCWQVIQWAQLELGKRTPDAAHDFSPRFEEELRRHKQRHGAVILPNVPDLCSAGDPASPQIDKVGAGTGADTAPGH
jgi:hypothetical protein